MNVLLLIFLAFSVIIVSLNNKEKKLLELNTSTIHLASFITFQVEGKITYR